MTAQIDRVFVDTGAWIALAVTSDPYHERARLAWADLSVGRCRLVTSVLVLIETFTFLDRNTRRDVACTWRDQATALPNVTIAECTLSDLTKCWTWFDMRGSRA
jgi:predicted nucleic acid-binding protein